MEKKLLLLIGANIKFTVQIEEMLSVNFHIHTVESVHSGYNLAIKYLPDIILIDQTSVGTESLKNLSHFKSSHFLNKILLVLHSAKEEKSTVEAYFNSEVDLFLYDSQTFEEISKLIINELNKVQYLTNYWRDSFMGLFNLMPYPFVLLQNEMIVSMNDAFRRTFHIERFKRVHISEFVHYRNKSKVVNILKKFSRNYHMKESIDAELLLNSKKVRMGKIYFSKLDKMISGQFIMMIYFSKEEDFLNGDVLNDMENKVSKKESNKEDQRFLNFHFTRREKEVLELLCSGYRTKGISDALCITEKTIEKHRSNIMKKTNCDTILESVLFALNHRIIELNYVS